MAIIDSHPRITVEVLSNRTPLQEYANDEEEDEPNTVTKYIEAQSGATFEIRCTLTRPFPANSLVYYVDLDGKRAYGTLCRQNTYKGTSAPYTVSGVTHTNPTGTYESKFCFSDLAIDDTDVSSVGGELVQTLKKVGEIRVEVSHVKNIRPSQSVRHWSGELAEVGTVPEKALKGRALTHTAGLRETKPVPARTYDTFDYIDGQPCLTFMFRYRSRHALQGLLIIPRTPSPVPLEDRDVDTLTPDEMRELLKRQKEREEATRKVKVERVKRERSRTLFEAGDDDDDDVSFVSEKRRKLTVTVDEAGVETIDLT